MFASFPAMACRREDLLLLLFFSFMFFFLFFFVSSMNFVACSFDHLCRKPTKMEIEKWSLEKLRKPSVYRSGVPPTNLHKQLK
jgi:hypothetical protein